MCVYARAHVHIYALSDQQEAMRGKVINPVEYEVYLEDVFGRGRPLKLRLISDLGLAAYFFVCCDVGKATF